MLTADKLAEFEAACRRAGVGQLRTDEYTRVLYSSDASLYQLMPHAVLVPRTTDDVIGAVALAAAHDVPVLPRAAGTSLAGQAVGEALIIDFTRHLDAIVAIDPEAQTATAQPGVVLDDLDAAARPYGLQFGPDPASSSRSTLGGAVANNATGSHSVVYGITADHVRGMAAVLADGTPARLGPEASHAPEAKRIGDAIAALVDDPANQAAIAAGTPRHRRRCGGYNLDRLPPGRPPDLAALVCGSEGTLAVMTEITVGLVPLPAATTLALLHFDDMHAALDATPGVLATGPSAVELLDTLSLRMCRGVPAYARLLASVVPGEPRCLLVVEYSGASAAEAYDGVARLRRLMPPGRAGVVEFTEALSPEHQSAVWRIRKAGLGLLMSMKGDMKPAPFIEDAAVPVESLGEYVRRVEAYCAGLDTPISYYGHAGAGCLHIRPLINTRSALHLARMADVARFSALLAKELGGAMSSEHGDGRARSWLNEAFFGRELYALYGQVKRIFDPFNQLNPGIITNPGPMTAHLRRPATAPDAPRLDFGDYERDSALPLRLTPAPDAPPASGLARAIDLCNGAAVCRQRIGGTMCPSFMVTREEEHSTRGRANALRAAMGGVPLGVLSPQGLSSPRLYETMALCVGCKACRAECPSAVDMARLKMEFLARYHEAHGMPLRTRLFGHVGTLNRLGSGAAAGLVNGLLARPRLWGRLGIASQRSLPALAREPFMTWYRRRPRPLRMSAAGGPSSVVLLIDPFTNYNEPAVGVAAIEFLEAAGLTVEPIAIDDGRALLSKGLLDGARRAAERTLAALWPLAKAGQPLVGLEPSSTLTLRDEYHYLLPGDERVPVVAAAALTFEEAVAGLAERGTLAVRWSGAPRRLLLHGHCHQKALVGTGPAHRALSLPPGYVVEEVDSGCCGMAGSFGYEAEHYDISMKMAERRLLPAVRAAGAETIIVAAGVSCRAQIGHGAGRVALHPAQVLRAALQA